MTFKFFATAFATVLSLTAFAGSGKADINIPPVLPIDPGVLEDITNPVLPGPSLVHQSGSARVGENLSLDLDTGQVVSGNNGDIRFFIRENDVEKMYIRAVNGAELGFVRRSASNHMTCHENTRMSPRNMRITSDRMDRTLCVRTNDGRTATIRMKQFFAYRDMMELAIDYTTWR